MALVLLAAGFCMVCGAMASARAPVYVKEVSDQGELLLEDGQKAVLAHVYLADGAADVIRQEVQDMPLNQWVTGTDRYGRRQVVLAIPSSGKSLQQLVLEQGRALIYSEDMKADLSELWPYEDEHAWPVVAASEDIASGFALVEGVVADVTVMKSQAYLNFGDDWKTDFTIMIPADVLRKMDKAQLEAMQGKKLRVRGMVHEYYGPRITLFRPDMMEVPDAAE